MPERTPEQRLAELAPYRDAGLDLIPLRRWDSRGAPSPEHPKGLLTGKAPRDPLWRRKVYTHEDIDRTVRAGGNVGLRIGPLQAVIDYDPRRDPDGAGRRALTASLPPGFLDLCPHVLTGGGGDHWLVVLEEPTPLRANVPDMPGVELKGHGRQVVAAGSIHPGDDAGLPPGNVYAWDDLSPRPSDAPVLPATSALLQAARRPDGGIGSKVEGGEFTGEQLAKLLAHLDPRNFREHDPWLQVAMACYHATGGDGLDAFIAWSTSDEQYADAEPTIRERWPTFDRDAGGPVVTVRTLFKLVADAGGSLQGLYDDEFPDLDEMLEEGVQLEPPPEPPAPVGVAGWGDDEIPEGPTAPLYQMNRRFCLTVEGGKTVIYERLPPEALERGEFPLRRHFAEGLRLMLKNCAMEVPGPKGGSLQVPVLEKWLTWGKRRQAPAGVVFAPDGAGPAYLNTWTGWGVVPAPNPWPLIERLIREVVTGGDGPAGEYVLNWCAHMVQRPAQQAEVALVLRGGRGVGKGTFAARDGLLGTIAGRHGLQVSSGIARRFNAFLRDAVYLFADEAFWAGDKAGEGMLKAMVTESAILVEPKGIEAYQAPNRLHIVIASNEDWVVPAGEDERRFAVFDVDPRYKGDFPFWTALRAEIAGGGAAGFLHAMLARDITSWHPRQGVPQTRALMGQKLESLHIVDAWWHSVLEDGVMPYAHPNADGTLADWSAQEVIVPRGDLIESFRAFAGRSANPRAASTSLGRRLRKMIPGLESVRSQGAGDRVRYYRIPSLPDARAQFEAHMRGPVTWSE